jgi:predicted SpoU family rRNA methylase
MKQAVESDITLHLQTLAHVLAEHPNVQFAVLISSQVNGTRHPDSDWNVTIAWQPELD